MTRLKALAIPSPGAAVTVMCAQPPKTFGRPDNNLCAADRLFKEHFQGRLMNNVPPVLLLCCNLSVDDHCFFSVKEKRERSGLAHKLCAVNSEASRPSGRISPLWIFCTVFKSQLRAD